MRCQEEGQGRKEKGQTGLHGSSAALMQVSVSTHQRATESSVGKLSTWDVGKLTKTKITFWEVQRKEMKLKEVVRFED